MPETPAPSSPVPEWRDDVRTGWLVTDQPDAHDDYLYAVRNRDGRVVESRTREGLVLGMCAADIAATWRAAGVQGG